MQPAPIKELEDSVAALHLQGIDVLQTFGGAEAFLDLLAQRLTIGGDGLHALLPADHGKRIPEHHDVKSGDGIYRWFFHYHSSGEHTQRLGGHFHLFAAPKFFGDTDGLLTHLIAIELDDTGDLAGFFVPNRWVTDERIRPAPSLFPCLESFRANEQSPSALLSYWLEALLGVFGPEIENLLVERDRFLDQMNATMRSHYLDNRAVERICELRIQ